MLADNAPVLIWRSGINKLCDWFNKPWLDFTGRTMDQEYGNGWSEGVHPDDYDRCLDTYITAFDAQESFVMDYRLRRHDGVFRWIRDSGMPYYADNGDFLGYFGTGIDIHDRVELESQQRLLINELNHRVKNTLATVQSMASQSFRSVPNCESAMSSFEGRLMALSRAHNLLAIEYWQHASLQQIAEDIATPFTADQHPRILISGPDVQLPSKLSLSLTLCLHELCTNATKYGALSIETGRVEVDWQFIEGEGSDDELELVWREYDGPPVVPPAEKGFGTFLIEKGLIREFGGTAQLDFNSRGVICVIRIPLSEQPEDQDFCRE